MRDVNDIELRRAFIIDLSINLLVNAELSRSQPIIRGALWIKTRAPEYDANQSAYFQWKFSKSEI